MLKRDTRPEQAFSPEAMLVRTHTHTHTRRRACILHIIINCIPKTVRRREYAVNTVRLGRVQRARYNNIIIIRREYIVLLLLSLL